MFELQSCKIIERETEKIDRNFYVNFATYQSTFVDENNEEYVYTDELILCNKVVSLSDCVSATCIKFYANKDKVHRKKMTLIEISRSIYSTYFDLYINGVFYKRGINIDDLTDLSYVYSMLKKYNFFVYDVMRSITSPSEYNLLVTREYK
nr:MAG TPA: hypothetical protein [Caudoviricetes sp.]